MNSAIKDFSVNYKTAALIKAAPILKENGGNDLYTALLIMKIFESVNPELQSELGDCYYQGEGVVQDIDKSLELFKKAAAKGSLRAQYDLGWFYYDRSEYLRAVEYFSCCLSRAAELDEFKLSRCHACLGDSYLKISEPKFSTAVEHLAIAADKYRNAFACCRLGMIYGEKDKQHFDAVKAIKYYELAISYGDVRAAYILASAYVKGNAELGIETDFRKAEKILLKFSESDNPELLFIAGLLYMKDDTENGFESDFHKSKKYFERLYQKDEDPSVEANLGYVYYRLDEYENAEKMLLLAERHGNYAYLDFLGRMYKDGLLGEKNLGKALVYYKKAYDERGALNNLFTFGEYAELLKDSGYYHEAYAVSDQGLTQYNDAHFLFIRASLVINGNVTDGISSSEAAIDLEACSRFETHKKEAHMMLGNYYRTVREFRKSENNYMQAFDMGVADAAYYLGKLYESGGGTISADINRAYEWYSKAANAGSVSGANEAACFKKGLFGGYRRVRSL